MNKPVFIVGLQKSGTSLLGSLFEELEIGVSHSGQVEDSHFWGNKPSFSPTEWPAGMIYQKYNGENGHEIGAEDATPDIVSKLRETMNENMAGLPGDKVVFGKSPYNTVRIPWVRAIFPESVIVAVVRQPAPAVYSLWKRFQPGTHTASPEEGWWGVKPHGWRSLVHEDKIIQLAQQWKAVNAKLWHDREMVDLFVPYAELCQTPGRTIDAIFELVFGKSGHKMDDIPELRCFDDEYKTGSSLRSKNKFDSGTLRPDDGKIELAPFTDDQVARIEGICQETKNNVNQQMSRAG